MRPLALDLCAGAGGLSLGLQRAGWSVLGVEHDPDAVATHRSQVGPCDLADLREWHPTRRYPFVAGGVPCQSFSQAGLREGTADPRGQLYLELLRIADEAHAEMFLLENVRGLISRGLDEIRTAAEDRGWLTRWALLDAADYGVPQHRRRLFLLGTRRAIRWQWPAPTHGPAGLLGLQPWVTVRHALGLGEAPHRAGRLPGAAGWQGIDRPAPTVSAGGTSAGGAEPFANQRQREALYAGLSAAGLLDRPSTTTQGDPRVAPAGHQERQQRGAVRLSVAQLAALQGFPPGFTFQGTLTSHYRQVGNAVPPPLAEAIGRALFEALS